MSIRPIIPYDRRLKSLSRRLRREMTGPEKALWARVRRKQLGVSVYRQRPLGRHIVDFYAPDAGLVIEVDGASHAGDRAHANDLQRQADLEALGLTVLRFSNERVLRDLDNVVMNITGWLEADPPEKQQNVSPRVPPSKGDRGMS